MAPVTKEMTGGAQAYPADGMPRKLTYRLTVQIDKQELVDVSRETGVKITGLRLRKRHLVRIRDAGKTIESFFFTFEDRGSPDLCLWLTPFYQTWSLSPPEKRPWCKCK